MYPILVVVIATLLFLFMDGVAGQYRDLTQLYQSRSRQIQIVSLAESIAQFYHENATFPASLAALYSSAGFQHVRSLIDSWQGYAVSPTINDGVWRFNRLVLYSNDPTKGTTAAAYLAANACGTGGYDTALSWCGTKDSNWFRLETRERYNDQIATQRARMARLLQKMSDHYNVNGGFPDKDRFNVALAPNSMTRVADLVGYSGSATNCSGTFTYMTIPVDCGDMFDLWGNPIGYQFVSNKHVLLVSETPIYNSSGNRLVIAAEYDFSLL
jgi:hypothetical protein